MTEHFSFFDAVETSAGVYDREYNAQQFTEYFKTLVTTGVMKGEGNELKVVVSGGNMISTVADGKAFIEGRYYGNDDNLNHTHDTETLGLKRIDRIVVRMNLNTNARDVKSFVKKGVASASPNPPNLTRDTNIYEISLAQIRVTGGQTFIKKEDVEDERGIDAFCPWAGSNILPNFDDEALEELIDKVDTMYPLTDGAYAKKFTGNLNELVESGFYITTGNIVNKPKELDYSANNLVEVIAANDNLHGWVIQRICNPSVGSLSRNYFRRGYYYPGLGWSWGLWEIDPRGRQENWITAVMTDGTQDTLYPIQYYKDDFGIVHIQGQVRGAFIAWYMPVGYRPEIPTTALALRPNAIGGYLSVQVNGYFVVNTSQDNLHTFDFSYRAGV